MIYYSILMNGKFLQSVEPNKNYSASGRAPTMGPRHIPAEYKSKWGNEVKRFEPLTAANYIKIIFEEFRWGDRRPTNIKIIPSEE